MQKSLKLNAALVHLTRLTPLLDTGVLKAFKTFRFERLTLSNCTGRQRSLGMNRI